LGLIEPAIVDDFVEELGRTSSRWNGLDGWQCSAVSTAGLLRADEGLPDRAAGVVLPPRLPAMPTT
jgi:hypothetical protein